MMIRALFLLVLSSPLVAQGTPIRICIDPGHGGSDTGAIGFGFEEADVNLDVALALRDLLEADTAATSGGGNWEVMMTRETDATVSLSARVAQANAWPADRFVSIHSNAFSRSAANGTETYAFAEGTTAAAMRDLIQDEMLVAWGLTDRGVKTANFFVLLNTTMPASLTELGFMTSPIDIQLLSVPDARQEAARAHLFALQRHFGFQPFDPVVATQTCVGDGSCAQCPCGNNVQNAIGGCANEVGASAVLDGSGDPSVSADSLRITLHSATRRRRRSRFWCRPSTCCRRTARARPVAASHRRCSTVCAVSADRYCATARVRRTSSATPA